MLDNDHIQTALKNRPAKRDENSAEQITSAPSQHDIDSYGPPLKSRVIKRSIVIGGHRTSVSLEDAFWLGLKEIAQNENVHLSDVVRNIDAERQYCNLSSAIRLYVFAYFHK